MANKHFKKCLSSTVNRKCKLNYSDNLSHLSMNECHEEFKGQQMQGRRDPYSPLMVVKTGTATVEIIVESPER